MNSHDEKILSEQYRQVPRVESPEHLDKQILEAAHRHTPAKRKGLINHWVPALATVCVAGVVFYIATPVIDSSTDLGPPASASKPEAMSDDAESFDQVLRGAEVVNNLGADLAVSKAQQKVVPAQRQMEQGDAPAARIQEELKRDQLSRVIPQEELSAEVGSRIEYNAAQSASDAKELKSDADILAETAPLPATQRSAKAAAPSTINNVQRKREVQLSVEEIASRIEKLHELADQALDEDANRLLEQLIIQCPDCALPEILAELNKNLEGQEQIKLKKQND